MQQDIKTAPAMEPSAKSVATQFAQIPVRMPDQAVEPQQTINNPMASPARAPVNTENDEHLDRILKDTSQAVKKADPNQSKPASQNSKTEGPKKPVLAIFAAASVAVFLLIVALASFKSSS